MIADEACWERGCACHDSRDSPGVELVKKREWVGLTDEDLEFWTGELGQGELGRGVIRAVADHLKERNT